MTSESGERPRPSVFGRGARLTRRAGAVAGPLVSAALHRIGRRPPESAEPSESAELPRGRSTSAPRGWLLRGRIWTGDSAEPFDGAVIVDGTGRVVRCAPDDALDWPPDLPTIGGTGFWVGPGVVDAHVHLQFADPNALLGTGLVAVRDLGGPETTARQWRTGHRPPRPGRPFIAISGPILTATGGYPTRSWGPDAGTFIDSPAAARSRVLALAADGVDVIKIALEPGPGWPVPAPSTVRAVVQTAHRAGLAVCAHALTAQMVRRAVDADVDELAHIPTERLDDDLVDRIAAAGMAVVSTLQTFFADGLGPAAAANAADLVAAGVELRYGTDLGNTGTQPGVDPRELDRLADAGLGRLGALRAATLLSARAPGIRGRSGDIRVGAPAALVVLPTDPLLEPGAWRSPTAVIADNRLVRRATARAAVATA